MTKEDQVKKAEQRLRIIEQIAKFREDKIRREFNKLEEDLRKDEERIKEEKMKKIRKQKYLEE